MTHADILLASATAANLGVSLYLMLSRANHYEALLKMVGGRPKFLWFGGTPGIGMIALVEIMTPVFWSLLAVAGLFCFSGFALHFAQMSGDVSMTLDGRELHSLGGASFCLAQFVIEKKLSLIGDVLPVQRAAIEGGPLSAALLLSLMAATVSAALNVLAEAGKALWYAVLCVLWKNGARDVLEGRKSDGWLARALGVPKGMQLRPIARAVRRVWYAPWTWLARNPQRA